MIIAAKVLENKKNKEHKHLSGAGTGTVFGPSRFSPQSDSHVMS